MPKIVGAYEIAHMLGVSRQRVWVLIQGADFPLPAAEIHAAKIWLLTDIEAWAKRTGRTLKPL